MGTKLNRIPYNEKELQELLQYIYLTAKQNYESNVQSNFTGILEVVASEPNIVSAIHKIKSNKGSGTSGVDKKVMDDYLGKKYDKVIQDVQHRLYNYKGSPVRRVWIPKPGKSERRPLGIPTIIDRIIQQCVKNVLEPIAEAQFFEHSYGFRPMRSAEMAVARIKRINFTAKCYWVVEGDIKGFFDNIDHNVMIKSMWNIGIRDKRILCIVKEMLKAGVMGECQISERGTPQGGIISPLLANIYLNRFDNFITGDFERKKLRHEYDRHDRKIQAMRKYSNLKTCYYVRYADDWVILTDNKRDAERLKHKAGRYLKSTLKLDLSEEKTLITNVCSKPVNFLGVEIRMVNKNGRWVNRVSPNRERLDRKLEGLKHEIFYLRKINSTNRDRIVQNIIRVNSMIVGLANYYSMCDQINVKIRGPSWLLKYTAYKSLKKYGGKWVKANEVSNQIGFNYGHSAHIPAIQYKQMYIGITDLNFAKWDNPRQKNQNENPYTTEGRDLYNSRMQKRPIGIRIDEVNSSEHAMALRMSKHKLYNFEYFMNRPYAYNRDRGKCRVCGGFLPPNEVRTHHVTTRLEKNRVNKVKNLISVHEFCHNLIHNEAEPQGLSDKTVKNILKYRELFSS